MFLLVPAYPGCPGSKAVKRSLLLLLLFSLMMDAYDQTIRLSCRALLTIVLVMSDFYSALCLAIVQFSSPFTLTEFIWPPSLGPSTGLEV